MSKSLFKKFSSKARGAFGTPKATRRQRTRLGVESLESRQLFSTAIVGGDSIKPTDLTQQLSPRTILGIAPGSTAATATAVGSDQGHVYQLTGTTIQVQATSTNDAFGIVFFDGDHGGVLVEFAGQGLVTVSLDTTLPTFNEGISAPTPGYSFVSSQGLAAINVQGASANGTIRITEINNSLDTAPLPAAGTAPTTNGVANIRSLSFTDTPTFNSILAADAIFAANSGSVGILAATTAVTTAVRIGNINASGSASASLDFSSLSTFANVQVFGGDLVNDNGAGFNEAGNTYGFGVEGLSGNFTNELGDTFVFTANTNIVNADLDAAISLPNSATTFDITDSTTQASVDSFFNFQTFNSSVILNIKTTDGTVDGLTIGNYATAFDGGLTILDAAATTASHGAFDGNLLVDRIGSLTVGTAANPVDLDGAVLSEGARTGNVTVFGDLGNDGGLAGATGLGNVTVHGNVYGDAPQFTNLDDAKFETLGTTSGLTADIGMITIDGHVNLTANNPAIFYSATNSFTGDAVPVLVNVAGTFAVAGEVAGLNAGGTLAGLSVGGAAGTAAIPAAFDSPIHDLGRIVFTVDSTKASGSITITDTTSVDFGGVSANFGAPLATGLGEGGAQLGDISVTTTGATSNLRLTGIIGGPTPFGLGVGPTSSAIGRVTLTAGEDLMLGADIGTGITSLNYALSSSDTAAGGTPTTAGLLLTAGRDVTSNGDVTLLGQLTSLPGVVVDAGRDIILTGSLGTGVTKSFGTLYFDAGEDIVNLPSTLLTPTAGLVTARTGTDVQIIAGGDIDPESVVFGVTGVTAFNNVTISTGATSTTTDFNEGLTPPTGDSILLDALAIHGATAGQITLNVDSAGAHLGSLDLESGAIDFTGAVTGVNANAAGTINLLDGGDIIAGSIGALQLGGAGNKAAINFIGGGPETAFILVDDGTSAIDSIGAITVRGFLNGTAAAADDFEIQAGKIGDVVISTDLSPVGTPLAPPASAISNFGILANNYRATAGDFNTYGGTGETLGTVTTTAGVSSTTASKIPQYSMGSVSITANGSGVLPGTSVFAGDNTFMALGGIKTATAGSTAGITINSGSANATLFASGGSAYFVAGDGDNDARNTTAAYSINGSTLSTLAGTSAANATIVAAGTRVAVSIGDVSVTAAGAFNQPTNISGITGTTTTTPGLAVLSAVHVAAANAPIDATTGTLTTGEAPQDDLPAAGGVTNNPIIQGNIGNVTLTALTAAGNGLLPVSDATPRPIEDFSSSGTFPLGIISATTSIGTVQSVAGLNFPSFLNGDSAVQVGVEPGGEPPRTLTEDTILVYLV